MMMSVDELKKLIIKNHYHVSLVFVASLRDLLPLKNDELIFLSTLMIYQVCQTLNSSKNSKEKLFLRR